MDPAATGLRAVLTGDIVGSSRLTASFRRELSGVLKRCAKDTRKAFPGAVPYDLSVFRGDAWQLIVSDPSAALRAALFFRAAVVERSPAGARLDTRVAIGIERIDFVPAGQVAEGDGPAFRKSGAALDALGDQSRMTIAGPVANPPLAVAVTLIDAIVQEWTAPQARAVKGRLRGLTQADIAESWPKPISQQAVGRHLQRAHWAAVDPALAWAEEVLKQP